ncbi:roadblock/LC7 domain-containing protein [Nocardiopsis sp. CNT312]|uniref:roadblock/LC7 domain-containing protein n=1 Tax=Nocardiopsis sp. CNT312 TaxID=1137268 RepID=UPI00048B8550|nr:roadblock/LC7 domain-containing protein [Nocardiopsis sp. CNT312]
MSTHTAGTDARPDTSSAAEGGRPGTGLSQLLQELVERTGAEQGVVLGRDGLYRARSAALDQVAAERSAAALHSIWSMADRAGHYAGRGEAETITVRCAGGLLALAPITPEAAVALVLGPNASLANAGYALIGFTEEAAAHVTNTRPAPSLAGVA